MSAQSVQLNSEATSQSYDLQPEGLNLSQVSRKPKQRTTRAGHGIQYTLHTDLLDEVGVTSVTTHEKTNMLTVHLQSRLGHRKPLAVHSVTVLCYFKSMLLPSTDVSPLIPILIIGYVQSQSTTVYAMIQWLPNATWAPVRLADHPDFLLDTGKSLVENNARRWFKLSVFC